MCGRISVRTMKFRISEELSGSIVLDFKREFGRIFCLIQNLYYVFYRSGLPHTSLRTSGLDRVRSMKLNEFINVIFLNN